MFYWFWHQSRRLPSKLQLLWQPNHTDPGVNHRKSGWRRLYGPRGRPFWAQIELRMSRRIEQKQWGMSGRPIPQMDLHLTALPDDVWASRVMTIDIRYMSELSQRLEISVGPALEPHLKPSIMTCFLFPSPNSDIAVHNLRELGIRLYCPPLT